MKTKRKIHIYSPGIFSDYCKGNLEITVPKPGRFCFNRTKIDTTFGIIGHENFVHRFRVVVEREGTLTNFSEGLRVKVIYLENEVIDCRLDVFLAKCHEYDPGTTWRGLYENQTTITNMAFYESPLIRDQFYSTLDTRLILKVKVTPLLRRKKPSMKRSLAFKFNHELSSDFVLKCEDQIFYVHSTILEHYSDVLAAFMRNYCQESRTKELAIEDFQPKTVEAFLKFMYIEAVPTVDIDIGLLQMSDKYNVTSLFEICDQFLANKININTPFQHIMNPYMMTAQMLKVPKITAKLIKWKQLDRSHDDLWTEFVAKSPSFSQMVANIIGTEHNTLWEDRTSNVTFSNTSKNIVVMS